MTLFPGLSGFLRRRAAAPALLAAGLAAAPAATAAAPGATMTYAAYVGGLPLGAMDVDLSVDARAYALDLRLSTQGFLGWLLPWSQTSRASGELDGAAGVRSGWARSEGTWRGRSRHMEIAYGPEGAEVRDAAPPLAGEDRDRVPPALTRGTRDLMSAVLEAGRRLDEGGTCDQRIAVFDGRRRYDMLFTDQGGDTLPASIYAPVAGPALRCGLRVEVIAGRLRSGGGARLVDRDQASRVWFKRIDPGLPPVPVRLETDTSFGLLVGHLTAVAPAPPPE